MQGTAWALVAPIAAIILAILTKEVYISLFSGVFIASILYCNFNLLNSINTTFNVITQSVDEKNMKIILPLVLLGTIVVLVNKSGGTKAYGKLASKKIKTKKSSLLTTQLFAIALFIDDYFGCLTTGNVMNPITDKNKVSRSKLTYVIHSTVVPICMLMPISSWAAAIIGSLEKSGANDGFQLFCEIIPYNYYCILALIMVFVTSAFNINYSKMLIHENNSEKGDIYSNNKKSNEFTFEKSETTTSKGKIIDILIPIMSLIVFCIIGLFLDKQYNTDNGLLLGAFISLIVTFFLYIPRKIMTLKDFLNSISEGFKEMAPAIIILTLAWSLNKITSDREYMYIGKFISEVISKSSSYTVLIPFILFVLSIFLSISTGTSWGTFSMLIPITFSIFPLGSRLLLLSIAAVLSGSACGDNISLISDTTVMSCSGTKCTIVNHISTQLPYAALAASISALNFLLAGFIQSQIISLILAIGLLLVILFAIKVFHQKAPKPMIK